MFLTQGQEHSFNFHENQRQGFQNRLHQHIDVCPWNCLCTKYLWIWGMWGRQETERLRYFNILYFQTQQAKSVHWWQGMNYETTDIGWEVAWSWGSVATSFLKLIGAFAQEGRSDVDRTQSVCGCGCNLHSMGPTGAFLTPEPQDKVGRKLKRDSQKPQFSEGLEGDATP